MESISNCIKVLISKDWYQREYIITKDSDIFMPINNIKSIKDIDRIMSFPNPNTAKEWINKNYNIIQNTINKYDDSIYVHFYVGRFIISFHFEPEYFDNLDKPFKMLNNNEEFINLENSINRVVKLADEFDEKLWQANNK